MTTALGVVYSDVDSTRTIPTEGEGRPVPPKKKTTVPLTGAMRQVTPRYAVNDLADARGIKAASLLTALYRTRRARAAGAEPVNPVPEPEPGRILSWRADRADVRAWMLSAVRVDARGR